MMEHWFWNKTSISNPNSNSNSGKFKFAMSVSYKYIIHFNCSNAGFVMISPWLRWPSTFLPVLRDNLLKKESLFYHMRWFLASGWNFVQMWTVDELNAYKKAFKNSDGSACSHVMRKPKWMFSIIGKWLWKTLFGKHVYIFVTNLKTFDSSQILQQSADQP